MVYIPPVPTDLIISFIEDSSQRETSTVSLSLSLTSPLYRKSIFVSQILILFHELTGSNAINLYSNQMLTEIGTDSLTPRTGTILLGLFSLIGVILALIIIKKYPRRTLLIPGHIMIGVCHLGIAVFAAASVGEGVVACMIGFVICYRVFNGPVIWLYVSEVVVDTALGISIATLWTCALLVSLITPFLMASPLKPHGVFFLLSLISLCGALFCHFFVQETRGLTDKEKKSLYSPAGVRRSKA